MNAREIKELVRHYNLGISPRRLGQHFLVDSRALARIAQEAQAGPADQVVEIGAGLGALTEELLATGATVYAVEKDARFLRVLTDRFKEQGNLQLVRSDVLKVDLGSYAMGRPESLLVVGNIPYSMTSPILEFLLLHRRWVRRALLTIQKEVADRIVAPPGSKAYSSISLLVRIAFRAKVAFTISPGSFYPQPKVTSAVLRLDPLEQAVAPPEEEEGLRRLIRGLFTHRRKTLLNALVIGGLGVEREKASEAIRRCGLNPVRRPETLKMEEFLSLHRALNRSGELVEP